MRPHETWLLIALAGLFAAAPSTVCAHAGSTKTIHAAVDDDGARLRVEIDAVDASLALGLGLDADTETLVEQGPLFAARIARGLRVTRAGEPCPAVASTVGSIAAVSGPAIAVEIDYACAGAGVLTLHDDTVFEDDVRHQAFVVVATDDGPKTTILSGETREVELGSTASSVDTASMFVGQGAIHLATGWDHMLFLLSLVLAAAMVARARGRRAALRDVAMVVTAFTIGHSVSLVGAALGVIALPSQLVETAIAASIVVVAALNVWRPQSAGLRPWAAGAIGLVHGFGFSSVLGEIGLPTGQRVLALLSFNVGIELAQLAFVTLAFVALVFVAARLGDVRRVVQGGSLAIATCGVVWLAERGLGL